MVSATSLIARSVMVKLEEDVPLATIQLILLAVCDTVEMAPSADSTRDVMEVTLWESVETSPSVFVIRVLKPLTVRDSSDTAPSALEMRRSKPDTVCRSWDISPSMVSMVDSIRPSAARNSCRMRSSCVEVEASRFGT